MEEQKRTRYRRLTVEAVEKAIAGSGGLYSVIAQRLGCSRWGAQKFIEKHPGLLKLVRDERETVNDACKATIIECIRSGDVASARWWLTHFDSECRARLSVGGTSEPVEIVVRYEQRTRNPEEEAGEG